MTDLVDVMSAVETAFTKWADQLGDMSLAEIVEYLKNDPFNLPEQNARPLANLLVQLRDEGDATIGAWKWFFSGRSVQ